VGFGNLACIGDMTWLGTFLFSGIFIKILPVKTHYRQFFSFFLQDYFKFRELGIYTQMYGIGINVVSLICGRTSSVFN
jgi:hypothetical protein